MLARPVIFTTGSAVQLAAAGCGRLFTCGVGLVLRPRAVGSPACVEWRMAGVSITAPVGESRVRMTTLHVTKYWCWAYEPELWRRDEQHSET